MPRHWYTGSPLQRVKKTARYKWVLVVTEHFTAWTLMPPNVYLIFGDEVGFDRRHRRPLAVFARFDGFYQHVQGGRALLHLRSLQVTN